MAQGRQRPPRSGRGGRGTRGGVPWLWLAVLVVVGGAVLAARTLGRPNGVEPRPAEPTLLARSAPTTSAPTSKTAAPAAAAVATPRPTMAPTSVPPRGPAPTRTRASVAPTMTATPITHATVVNPVGTREVAAVTPAPTAGAPNVPQTGVAGAQAQTNVGAVALTFDAGADRGYAEDILDILAEQHVEASFGITGDWAKANPDLVRRMAADGHLVFNHSLDHRSFTGLSDARGGLPAAARRAELDDADAIIAPLIGHSTRPFYRLPYGDDDARVATDVAPAGYTRKIGWTVDSLGWRGAQSTDIVARCLRLAASGAVYVFHVGHASQDAIALPQLMHALRDRGYGFRRADAPSP